MISSSRLLVIPRPDYPKQSFSFDQLGDNYRVVVKAYLDRTKHHQGETNWYQPVADPHFQPKYEGQSPPVAEVSINVREMTEMERIGTNLFKERYGYAFKEKGAEWTKQELEWLQDILRDLPDTYYHMKSLRQLEKVRQTENGAGAEYLWRKRVVQVTWQAADDTVSKIGRILCWPYDTAKQKFKGYIVHEMTHALQFCDILTKDFLICTENPLVMEYAEVAGWKTFTEYTGNPQCLPGFSPERWAVDVGAELTNHKDRGVCLRSRANVFEDMAEAAKFYVLQIPELRLEHWLCFDKGREDFLRERVFKGKVYPYE